MRTFSVAEARALLPAVQDAAAELIDLRADLAVARAAGEDAALPLAETKALEARVHELIEWFPEQGLELKGIAPLLLDFPSTLDGEPVLLCWLEGEEDLAWYHRAELGFLGRRRLR